jgi:hypothetical protein
VLSLCLCCVLRVLSTGLRPPYIVKPRVACGVAHSHSMALVLSTGGLQQLQGQVPLPALVQEFVNHGGQQYKVYVMGDQVSAGTHLWVALLAYIHPLCDLFWDIALTPDLRDWGTLSTRPHGHPQEPLACW